MVPGPDSPLAHGEVIMKRILRTVVARCECHQDTLIVKKMLQTVVAKCRDVIKIVKKMLQTVVARYRILICLIVVVGPGGWWPLLICSYENAITSNKCLRTYLYVLNGPRT